MRMLKMLAQLDGAADWPGVAAQERAARAVANAVRTSMPSKASFVYCTLGRAFQMLGDYAKAIEYHVQHLAIAKEVGARVGEGVAYGNLGNGYHRVPHAAPGDCKGGGGPGGGGHGVGNLGNANDWLGDFNKAIEYHTQHLSIAKEVGDRVGEGKAYANLGTVLLHLNE